MSDDSPWLDGGDLPPGLLLRRDGVFFDAGLRALAFMAAVERIFFSGAYFTALDYAAFSAALYGGGAELRRARVSRGAPLLRFASAIARFDPHRRALYKQHKIRDGVAEYYFEASFLETGPAGEGGTRPAPPPVRLDFDEFVAHLWCQGVRFGIDAAAVCAVIASGKVERVVVARRLEPAPGSDAAIVEVSQQMQRDDSPREMANGRLDLLTFKNRFPQVKKNARLLKKVAATPGRPGYELSGAALVPAPAREVDLGALAGAGTVVEHLRDGDFLVAQHDGFVNVDADSGAISLDVKIVSHDGVSGRTTGNLKLRAEYEEFGDVQEQRLVEGADISIHGDVFGHLQSFGGRITMHGKVIGGSAGNARGDILVMGVASGATLQAREGEVRVERAENCVISGTRVVVKQASNCEIVGDDVTVGVAEGCAIAGRRIRIDAAGPRKQAEMLIFPLLPEMQRFDRRIAEFGVRADGYARAALRLRREIEQAGQHPDMRNYLLLAERVHKQELLLSAEQVAPFQKLALVAAPALKMIAALTTELLQMEAQEAAMHEQARQVEGRKRDTAGQTRCAVGRIVGDVLVRTLVFNREGGPAHDRPAKDIKAMLRGGGAGVDIVFAGQSGSLDWTYALPQE